MRMRKKKYRDARIRARSDLYLVPGNIILMPYTDSACRHHIKRCLHKNNDISCVFKDSNTSCPYQNNFKMPVFLEIGCGKGGFICDTAQLNPDINFVAIEKNQDVMVLAMEKADSLGLRNVRFLIADAENLAEYFAPGEVSGIYLNFSDPWHKNYQAHKRLTHKKFLEIYKKILITGSKIIIKTDNQNLFDFSVFSLFANGFKILSETRDLYSSEFLEGNVQTEYEKKFVSEGVKICRVEAEWNQ